jgi:hypothetical protein
LGAPVPFSERSLFQDEMMGIKYLSDLALEAGLCQLFVDTCTTTKRLLEACIVD